MKIFIKLNLFFLLFLFATPSTFTSLRHENKLAKKSIARFEEESFQEPRPTLRQFAQKSNDYAELDNEGIMPFDTQQQSSDKRTNPYNRQVKTLINFYQPQTEEQTPYNIQSQTNLQQTNNRSENYFKQLREIQEEDVPHITTPCLTPPFLQNEDAIIERKQFSDQFWDLLYQQEQYEKQKNQALHRNIERINFYKKLEDKSDDIVRTNMRKDRYKSKKEEFTDSDSLALFKEWKQARSDMYIQHYLEQKAR